MGRGGRSLSWPTEFQEEDVGSPPLWFPIPSARIEETQPSARIEETLLQRLCDLRAVASQL